MVYEGYRERVIKNEYIKLFKNDTIIIKRSLRETPHIDSLKFTDGKKKSILIIIEGVFFESLLSGQTFIC